MSASFCSKSEREVEILTIIIGPFSGPVNHANVSVNFCRKRDADKIDKEAYCLLSLL